MEKITIEKENITYSLMRRKNMKRIILKIRDGEIIASAPNYVPLKTINDLVIKSKDKLYEIDQKNKAKVKVEYIDGGIFKFFGHVYTIKVDDKRKNHCEIIGDELVVYSQNIEGVVKKFMKEQLYIVVMALVKNYPLNTGGKRFIPEVVIKPLKSMYGVCYFYQNKIGISLMMVHEPKWIIEYVVVHELTHFIHKNHSKHFYNTVAEILPNYKEAVKYLKQGGF